MIRLGDWKLNYYHGYDQPYQLFNMIEDPDELSDRAADPACAEVVSRLSARLMDGWDPVAITSRAEEMRDDSTVATPAPAIRFSGRFL